LDFFVYYHHPALVEAFGRTTLEALASGAVCILPPHFQPMFGEACLYADSVGVRGLVEALHHDRNAYDTQSSIGRSTVEERFSHAAHVARLAKLVGSPRIHRSPNRFGRSPSVPPDAPIPARVAADVPTVLIAALGASNRQLERALREIDRRRAKAGGFRPVLVCTSRAPALAARLGIPVEVVTSRENWKGAPEKWPEYAQKRLRQIAQHRQASNITVLDLAHPDAWIALRVRPPAGDVASAASAPAAQTE
jgi:hypothetical protein